SLLISYFSITRQFSDTSPTAPRPFPDRLDYRMLPIRCLLAIYAVLIPRQIVDRCATDEHRVVPTPPGVPPSLDEAQGFEALKASLNCFLRDAPAVGMYRRSAC